MTSSAARRTYLDVLRGVAVLIMIEAHVIDSWTTAADRGSRAFGRSLILGRLRRAAVSSSGGRVGCALGRLEGAAAR